MSDQTTPTCKHLDLDALRDAIRSEIADYLPDYPDHGRTLEACTDRVMACVLQAAPPVQSQSKQGAWPFDCEWIDADGQRAVIRGGRLSLYGSPSMTGTDGSVAIGIDLPRPAKQGEGRA